MEIIAPEILNYRTLATSSNLHVLVMTDYCTCTLYSLFIAQTYLKSVRINPSGRFLAVLRVTL
jgi:hypothetical protein